MSKLKPFLAAALSLSALAVSCTYQTETGSDPGPRSRLSENDLPTLNQLAQMHDVNRWSNVWPNDGRFLHDLIVERGFRRGLEIGTSNGYSAIWMGMALRKTGGTLITIEIDSELAGLARENFARAEMNKVIELREGDALETIPQLEGPFDFVFIDAYKPDYNDYLFMVYPKVSFGGAILAHDVVWHAGQMQDFLRTIVASPGLDTHIELPSGAGISVSVKKRVEADQADQPPEPLVTH
jgi:predicted O-methyltransferase YrrM